MVETNEALEAFLSGGSEPAPDQQAPPAEPKAPEPPKEPPKPPETEPEDEGEPPEPSPGEPVVPRRALEDERHKRQNYVAQAAKFEAERDMLAKQLEELKRAPAQPQGQPQPQAQYQPINPAENPQAYHQQVQATLLNERLNMSQMMLTKEMGAEKVQAAIAEFKQHAAADPRLYTQLYQQPDPYGWMASEVDRLRLIREVTTDPAGYEAKLRAKWEAEGGTPQAPAPRVSPVAGLAPSLANVRSALPRSSAAYTGPQSLDDILGQRATNTRH